MTSSASLAQAEHKNEARVADYIALLKPKVMSLVVFTGFAGFWIAPGAANIHPFLAFIGMAYLALGAGAAGAINMWYDRDIDAVMKRTMNRPLPLNKIEADDALGFGIICSILSVMVMGLALNWMAAALLAAGNLFYVLIYTVLLKRSTPQNIVIGGAAGAFPPMIGWAMATGDISLMPCLMFLIIFLWTPPHFWALSLFANEDYKRAGIPMMTVTSGARSTKIQMLAYTLILLPVTLMPWLLGYAGMAYGISAAVLSGFFVLTACRVLASDDLKHAKAMFGYSVFYLFALFLALMIV
ncbi:MAG: heme o synthase [Alphaproteobacteria bacterium]|nr:heme o synthase [Alphaproteobacteria bacterium]MCD8525943.1 heme o synthase [Alphaproteobacteria bacterium]MCD8571086.1 heme o synthase [Alphaproteobacteria bacterium]